MLTWGHGKKTEIGIWGGCLSCDEPGESPASDLPYGRGPEHVFVLVAGGLRADGMDRPCVRSDGQPLSYFAGNA